MANERTSTEGVEIPAEYPETLSLEFTGEPASYLYLRLGRLALLSPVWRRKTFCFNTKFKVGHYFSAACEGKMCSENAKKCREM